MVWRGGPALTLRLEDWICDALNLSHIHNALVFKLLGEEYCLVECHIVVPFGGFPRMRGNILLCWLVRLHSVSPLLSLVHHGKVVPLWRALLLVDWLEIGKELSLSLNLHFFRHVIKWTDLGGVNPILNYLYFGLKNVLFLINSVR